MFHYMVIPTFAHSLPILAVYLLCMMDLHRPVTVSGRFKLDQGGHASLEPGSSYFLELNERRVESHGWQIRAVH